MKKLGFGLMRLPLADPKDGSKVDLPLFTKMVDCFLDRGFTYFDTAYMYHGGQSECFAREALVKRHPRDSFTLTDKMPAMMLQTADDLPRIFSEQLTKCGVTFFDYYLLHALDAHSYATSKRLGAFDFVRRLKAEGKVRQYGFSFHGDAPLLETILTENPDVDVVQLQINYLDWDDPNVQSGACYEIARRHGKKIIVMEPVKGGTLAKLPASAAAQFREARPSASPASWAIRFAAGLENVMVVLSGMSTEEQLLDNTGFMSDFSPLSAQESEIVRRVAHYLHRDAAKIPCTGCSYCTGGCPKQIPIPALFAAYNDEMRESDPAAYRAACAEASAGRGKADDCISCGQCERMCPQHLPIPLLLRDAAALLKNEK